MKAYLIDAASGVIERVEYVCWGDLGPHYLDCDEPVFVYAFPWGDTLLATDPVPEGAEYFRITALADGSGAEHDGSHPIGYKAVLIGMQDDKGWHLPPCLDIGTLSEWIEVLP
jgi:hypothetical protein